MLYNHVNDENHTGYDPSVSFKAASIPSDDSEKELPADVERSPKACRNCLGRDTIANAAAKVGPAVVNLSVPQGTQFSNWNCHLLL